MLICTRHNFICADNTAQIIALPIGTRIVKCFIRSDYLQRWENWIVWINPLQCLFYTLKWFRTILCTVSLITRMTTSEFQWKWFRQMEPIIKNCERIIQLFPDETLWRIVARKKSWHLSAGAFNAVHDDMLISLSMGDKLYPELNERFIKSPDKTVAQLPSASE